MYFQVSGHLQDAHEWFKSKFDKLQQEILDSRYIKMAALGWSHDLKNMVHVFYSKMPLEIDRH